MRRKAKVDLASFVPGLERASASGAPASSNFMPGQEGAEGKKVQWFLSILDLYSSSCLHGSLPAATSRAQTLGVLDTESRDITTCWSRQVGRVMRSYRVGRQTSLLRRKSCLLPPSRSRGHHQLCHILYFVPSENKPR